VVCPLEPVLGQHSVDPLLELRPLPHQHHPGSRKFQLAPHLTRGNSHLRKSAGPLELVEPAGIQLISFAHRPSESLPCPHIPTRAESLSISSTTHYQLPTVSTATGEPSQQWERNSRKLLRWWSMLPSRSTQPCSPFTTRVYRLWQSKATCSMARPPSLWAKLTSAHGARFHNLTSRKTTLT